MGKRLLQRSRISDQSGVQDARRGCSALAKASSTKKRAAGIEPASSAWKAEVLPLNYARDSTGVLELVRWNRLQHYDLHRITDTGQPPPERLQV